MQLKLQKDYSLGAKLAAEILSAKLFSFDGVLTSALCWYESSIELSRSDIKTLPETVLWRSKLVDFWWLYEGKVTSGNLTCSSKVR